MKKRIIVIVSAVVAAYVVAYLVLTLLGEFRVVTAKPHDMLYEPAGKAYEVEMWFPAGIMFQTDYATDGQPRQSRRNLLGTIFSPLVQTDRWCWHQTAVIVRIIEPEPINGEPGEQRPEPYR